MKLFSFILMLPLSFLLGLAFHAYQKEWIIFLLPHQTTSRPTEVNLPNITYAPEKITVYFFKHERWHSEHNSVIWSSDMAQNVKTTVNNWLALLEDEKIIDTDIQISSAITTINKELFLSFNKDLFDKQDATFSKLMIIESLLKTLRENKIPVQSVRFLVHHQTLVDDHLNFSISWPINGYLQIS